jgi:hypothetical protein
MSKRKVWRNSRSFNTVHEAGCAVYSKLRYPLQAYQEALSQKLVWVVEEVLGILN